MQTHKTGSIRVTVSNAGSVYGLILSQRSVARALRGARLTIKGQGVRVGARRDQDQWHFNTIEDHSLVVTLSNGLDVFAGTIEEATIQKV